MKLYMVPLAPNPTKVMLYIAERAELGTEMGIEQMGIEQIVVGQLEGDLAAAVVPVHEVLPPAVDVIPEREERFVAADVAAMVGEHPLACCEIGVAVEVDDQAADRDGDEMEFFVAPAENKIAGVLLASPDSPLGGALLGATPGETVSYDAPGGVFSYEVKAVRVYEG